MIPKPEWLDTFKAMRAKGWAVVWFSPDELQGVDAERFEERLADDGFDLVERMQPEEPMIWGPDDCPEELEHTNRGLWWN